MSAACEVGPRRIGQIGRPIARYAVPEAVAGSGQGVDERLGAALEAAWRPNAGHVPHQQSQIRAGDMHQETIVVVLPISAPCTVTPTTAPVSKSTACSALWAKCVQPSVILGIIAKS